MPGPLPDPNVTTVVGAGNAAGLFPAITPAPTTPSQGPGRASPVAERRISDAGRVVDVFTGAPATPVLALVALVIAFLLMMTRLSARRRMNRRGPKG